MSDRSDWLRGALRNLGEEFLGTVTRFFNYFACAALLFMPNPCFDGRWHESHIWSYSILGGIEIQEFLMVILVFFGVAAVELREEGISR